MTKIIVKRVIVNTLLALFFLQLGNSSLFGQNLSKEIRREGVDYKLTNKPLYIDPIYNGSTDPMVCFNRNANKW